MLFRSNIHGGLGDAVASVLSESSPVPLLKIGLHDTFAESGTHRELWMKYGLDTQNGGIYTCVGRDGQLLDTTKSVWFQGRFAFTCCFA